MKIREVIIPSVIGAFLSAVSLAVISGSTTLPEEFMLVAIALGVGFGGLIAAYLATKGEKDKLEKGLLAGVITGILLEVLVFSVMFLGIIANTTIAEQVLIAPELVFVAVASTASLIAVGGTGALVCVWLLGMGKSKLKDVFIKSWKKLRKEKELVLGVLVLSAIPAAIEKLFEAKIISFAGLGLSALPVIGEAGLADGLVMSFFYLIMGLFAYNGILQSYKKRSSNVVEFLKTSIVTCVPIVKAVVISAIPIILLLIGLEVAATHPSFANELGVLAIIGMGFLTLVYVTLIFYIGQEIVLKKKGTFKAIKSSAVFMREKFWLVILLGTLFLVVLLPIELAFSAVDFIVPNAVDLTTFLASYVGMLIGITIQTQFYKDYSGKK